MTALSLFPKDFKPGDRTRLGTTIVAELSLVKGGIEFLVETDGGRRTTLVFDGRRRYEMTRKDNA
jgi:hypothetical protein